MMGTDRETPRGLTWMPEYRVEWLGLFHSKYLAIVKRFPSTRGDPFYVLRIFRWVFFCRPRALYLRVISSESDSGAAPQDGHHPGKDPGKAP